MQNERKETKFFICQDKQQCILFEGSSNQIFYIYQTELKDVVLNPQNKTQIQCLTMNLLKIEDIADVSHINK